MKIFLGTVGLRGPIPDGYTAICATSLLESASLHSSIPLAPPSALADPLHPSCLHFIELSGGARIDLVADDAKIAVRFSSGFPSVGPSLCSLGQGRWYYEVSLQTAGLAQIGWATADFKPNASLGEGVGDDIHSIAYDGHRFVCCDVE